MRPPGKAAIRADNRINRIDSKRNPDPNRTRTGPADGAAAAHSSGGPRVPGTAHPGQPRTGEPRSFVADFARRLEIGRPGSDRQLSQWRGSAGEDRVPR